MDVCLRHEKREPQDALGPLVGVRYGSGPLSCPSRFTEFPHFVLGAAFQGSAPKYWRWQGFASAGMPCSFLCISLVFLSAVGRNNVVSTPYSQYQAANWDEGRRFIR